MNLDLIQDYIDTNEFLWDNQTQQSFRNLYYKLFLESFGQSRRCWDIAIKKVHKEILSKK